MASPVKIYRFALFGRSDSGKTCILTAMSMSHKSNPAGYTVTWVPDPPDADDAEPDVAEQYQQGKAMLARARASMDAGDKPPPTALRILRYRFDFTTKKPHPRAYKVELADYSGELIDPRMNAETLARKLRTLLGTMDGLFILAEAPRHGAEAARLSREFELLQQAFALLAAEKERRKVAAHTPVVLMFNKWDRRHPQPCSPAERAAQVTEFLDGEPEPPHRALADFLGGAVAAGCFHSVAVSAFGRARIESQTDQDGMTRQVELPPTDRPLPSFGLEDGFVWAAQTRDDIDLDDYEQKTRALAVANAIPWLGLNAFNPFSPRDLRKEGAVLAGRFPKASEPHRRARAGVMKAMRVGAIRTAALTATIVAAVLGGEALLDVTRFRRAEADLARADLGMADLARYQATLEAYQKAPDYRHLASRLVVSRAAAKELLDRIIDRREGVAWAAVDALKPDTIAQEDPARAYLKEFENGPHARQAIEIVQTAEPLRKERDNRLHLDRAAAKLGEIGQAVVPSKPEIATAIGLLDAVPHPEALTPDQAKTLAELRQRAGGMLAQAERGEARERLGRFLANGQFEEAGAVAETIKTAGEETASGARDMMTRAGDKVAAFVRDGKWAAARAIAANVRRGWANRRLLDAGQISTVSGWEEAAFRGQDKDLYGEVVTYRDRARCQAYLNSEVPEGLKRKKADVTEFQTYLDQRDGELMLTIKLTQVYMGTRDTFARLNIGCTAYVNNTQIYRGTRMEWGVNSTNTINASLLGANTFKLKLKETVKVKLGLWNDGFNTDDLGDAEWSGAVEDLNGRKIDFTKTNYYKAGGKASEAYFSVEGIPTAPSLPAYPES